MVDISKRKQAAVLIHQFVEGQISNDDYDSDFPDDTGDEGLLAVYDRLWLLYSDLAPSRLHKTSLTNDEQAVIERCVLFLGTNLEYEGPRIRERKTFAGLKNMLGRLIATEPNSVMGREAQENSVFLSGWWPFANEEQYRSAREHQPA